MKSVFNFNELTSEEVLDAVKTLTDGTYETPFHSSTLVGYSHSYDRYGRPLHANPNKITGTVCIEGLNYKVVKSGFNVEIYNLYTIYSGDYCTMLFQQISLYTQT